MKYENVDLSHMEEKHLNLIEATPDEQVDFMNRARSTIKRLLLVGKKNNTYDGPVWEENIYGSKKYLAGWIRIIEGNIGEFFVCLGDDADPSFRQGCIFLINPITQGGQIYACTTDVQELIDMMDIFKVQVRGMAKDIEFMR